MSENTFPDAIHLLKLQTDLWKTPISRAAVMVGAGFSLNANKLPQATRTMPMWSELVWKMYEELHPEVESEQLRQAFMKENLLVVASEYQASFGRGKLEALIQSELADLNYTPSKLHELLMKLPWRDVYTTNYDTLLERTPVDGRFYQTVRTASDLTDVFSPRIIKLHGSFPANKPYIITEEDFRRYPIDFAPFVNSVRQSLIENAFVLIGFSGEDPNFLSWTGWVRDQLGNKHCPIYLVGPLNLSQAKRSLLYARGVTPIDLHPLFGHISNGLERHSKSTEWFLKSLLIAKPPRIEDWRNSDTPSSSSDHIAPPLFYKKNIKPKAVGLSPASGDKLENIHIDIYEDWKYQREQYPKWLVASNSVRENLWSYTSGWMNFILYNRTLSLNSKILIVRELVWRLDVALIPLIGDVVTEVEKLVVEWEFDDTIDNYSNVCEAWGELVLALMREAREMFNYERWSEFEKRLKSKDEIFERFLDRFHYERALWHIWNIERKNALKCLSDWSISYDKPQWLIRKMGLLAELGQLELVRTELRVCLKKIRQSLNLVRHDVRLLSLEGWCMKLLFTVENSLSFRDRPSYLAEFWERWKELEYWDCSPILIKSYFDKILHGEAPVMKSGAIDYKKFDVGSISTTYHFSGWSSIDAILPAFGYLRFFEESGTPMSIPSINITGKSLGVATKWIEKDICYWNFAILVRSLDYKDLEGGDVLSRRQVALMPIEIAERLFDWSLKMIQNEIAIINDFNSGLKLDANYIKGGVCICSKLSMRLCPERLESSFRVALSLNELSEIRNSPLNYEIAHIWFKRLFEVSNLDQFTRWYAEILKLEIPLHNRITSEQRDPIQYVDTNRITSLSEVDVSCLESIKYSIDWLLGLNPKIERIEDGVILERLSHAYWSDLMTDSQTIQLGALLWAKNLKEGYPRLSRYTAFSMLNLPSPEEINVEERFKSHVLDEPFHCVVGYNEGRINLTGSVCRWVEEVIYASEPVTKTFGKNAASVRWTADESLKLVEKIKTWWEQEKVILKQDTSYDLMGNIRSFRKMVSYIPYLISRIEFDSTKSGELAFHLYSELIDDLDLNEVNILIALPYLVRRGHVSVNDAITRIGSALRSSDKSDVSLAIQAIRHWEVLRSHGQLKGSSKRLLKELINKVLFRDGAALSKSMFELAQIIFEIPQLFSKDDMQLLAASLKPWEEVTRLNDAIEISPSNFSDGDDMLRLNLCVLIAAVKYWFTVKKVHQIEMVEAVIEVMKNDPLPEVRNRISDWMEYKNDK